MGRRPLALALVVGDDPLGDAEEIAELGLGEAGGLTKPSQALAEGLEVGGRHRFRLRGLPGQGLSGGSHALIVEGTPGND